MRFFDYSLISYISNLRIYNLNNDLDVILEAQGAQFFIFCNIIPCKESATPPDYTVAPW